MAYFLDMFFCAVGVEHFVDEVGIAGYILEAGWKLSVEAIEI